MSPASRDSAVQLSLGPSVACSSGGPRPHVSSGPLNILFLQPGGFPLGWLLSLGTWSPGLPGWDRNPPLASWPQVQGPVWPCIHLCLVSQDQMPGWEMCKKYIEENREGGWEAWTQGTREEETAGRVGARTDSWPSQSQPSGRLSQIPASHPGLQRKGGGVLWGAAHGHPPAPGVFLRVQESPSSASQSPEHPLLQSFTDPCGGPSRGSGQSWVGTPAPLLVSCVASSSHHPLSVP